MIVSANKWKELFKNLMLLGAIIATTVFTTSLFFPGFEGLAVLIVTLLGVLLRMALN